MTSRDEDIGVLKALVESLQREVATLREKSDERIGSIAKLNAEVASLEAAISGLQRDRRSVILAVITAVIGAIVASFKWGSSTGAG